MQYLTQRSSVPEKPHSSPVSTQGLHHYHCNSTPLKPLFEPTFPISEEIPLVCRPWCSHLPESDSKMGLLISFKRLLWNWERELKPLNVLFLVAQRSWKGLSEVSLVPSFPSEAFPITLFSSNNQSSAKLSPVQFPSLLFSSKAPFFLVSVGYRRLCLHNSDYFSISGDHPLPEHQTQLYESIYRKSLRPKGRS